MPRALIDLTLTVLPDGRVLSAGGYDQTQTNQVAEAEIYDPSTGTWTSAGLMGNRRGWHTATLMPGGNVLVVGGAGIPTSTTNGSPGPSFTAEMYDLLSATWQPYGLLRSERRSDHRAVMLLTGNLLVIGGANGGGAAVSTTEAPRGPTGAVSSVVSAQSPRSGHRAVSVGALNQILIAGGWSGTSEQATCELIDPVAGTRSFTGSLGTARERFILIQLAGGAILAAGGWDGFNPITASERYSPGGGWTNTFNTMGTARYDHLAVLLKDGRVLAAGGFGTSGAAVGGAEIYSPATDSWTTAGTLQNARYHFAMNRLYNGKVLVLGGWDGTTTFGTTEVYDPTTGTWSLGAAMPTARRHHTATTLPDASILVVGGRNSGGFTQATADIYYPWTNTWATGTAVPPAMPGTRRDHTAVQQLDGRILVFGGWNSAGTRLADPLLYDFQSNTWASVTAGIVPTSRTEHVMVMHGYQVVINGGQTGATFLASSEAVDDHRIASPSQPVITSVNSLTTQPVALTRGNTVTVAGTGFRGAGEGSGGTNGNSAADLPVVTLTGPVGGASGRNLHGDPQVWREVSTVFSSGTSVDFVAPAVGSNVGAGIYALRVTVNGVPSPPFWVSLP